MKKISAIILSTILAYGAQAQGIGVIGGVTLNNQLDHYTGETTSSELKTGYMGGVLFDIGLSKHWSLQPGIEYVLKGGLQTRSFDFVSNDGIHQAQVKEKNSLHYIEVPLNLVYKFGTGCSHLFVGVGGYGAVLASAYTDSKYTDKVEGATVAETKARYHLKVGDKRTDGDDLHRFDGGLTAILGYEMRSGLFFRAGVDAGLYNIINGADVTAYQATLPPTVNNADASSKNISYNFGVGFMFR